MEHIPIPKKMFKQMMKFFDNNNISLIDMNESRLDHIEVIDENWLFEQLNEYLQGERK